MFHLIRTYLADEAYSIVEPCIDPAKYETDYPDWIWEGYYDDPISALKEIFHWKVKIYRINRDLKKLQKQKNLVPPPPKFF